MKRGYQANSAVMRECKYPNIKSYLEEHGMSVRALAQKCGMCYATLYYILTGRQQPRKRSIGRILRATGMTLEAAFGSCEEVITEEA